MCKFSSLVGGVVWLVLAAHPVCGEIIERDLYAPGDRLLTYDTVNGREWLDLSATPTVSYAQLQTVFTQQEMLDLFGGFQRANAADVYALAVSAGIAPEAFGHAPARAANEAEIAATFQLAQAVCGTECAYGNGNWRAEGKVGFFSLFENETVIIDSWNSRPPLFSGPGAAIYGQLQLSTIEAPEWYFELMRNSSVGSLWLYRAAVPEPETLGMTISGMFLMLVSGRGLAAIRRGSEKGGRRSGEGGK